MVIQIWEYIFTFFRLHAEKQQKVICIEPKPCPYDLHALVFAVKFSNSNRY